MAREPHFAAVSRACPDDYRPLHGDAPAGHGSPMGRYAPRVPPSRAGVPAGVVRFCGNSRSVTENAL